MTKYQKIFNDIKSTTDYKVVGEDIDYKVFADHETREVILQFEESDSRKDWIHNISILPVPLKLEKGMYVWTTRGYACAYKSAENKPIDEFVSLCLHYKTYRWVIRGWSFGSAMTKIATRHFYKRTGKAVDECITYGDVKCWINPFIHLLAKKYSRKTLNFTTSNDFVTWCVPFYWRTAKAKVGRRFNIKEIFNTEYYHTHYEEYDYSKYE